MRTLIITAVLAVAALCAGCWDDTCPEGCQPGYACYYGECLSRGFCPYDSSNSTMSNCAQYDSNGQCIQTVDHGICNRGYVCVCRDFDPATGACTGRYCEEDTSVDE